MAEFKQNLLHLLDMSAISERDGLSDEEIRRILSAHQRVAVVGMSKDPVKPAHYVPKFLLRHGFDVVPVNPTAEEILGLKAFKSLLEVQGPVDVADVFRPSDQILPIAEQALKIKPRIFWMQEGIYNREAAEMLRKAGVTVVWNRCMMQEHNRLFGSKPLVDLGHLHAK